MITTHSPFVARALPLGSGVILVKSGGITEANESELIKKALGWGALDKPILLCTEDSKANEMSELLRQDGDIDNLVSVFPFNGVETLGHAPVLADLRRKLGGHHKVIVHRDRDCRSDDEVADWRQSYTNHGIEPWVTDGSDIEMYFCSPHYISTLYGISFSDAEAAIESVINTNLTKLKSEFLEKRKQINKRYEKTGGSPSSETLMNDWHWSKWVKGKTLISKIRDWAKNAGYDEKLIGRSDENIVTAIDLIRQLYVIAQK
ncbi:hypothetical protein GCM10022268_16890 [Sphingomonas cynarae]|uniref:ATPase AAA-type core domain-containing protein n=1 Tax=Sphingomonas cynarae TaxID=930197 RepID=A0ABP7DRK2_9SPHN